MISSGQWKAIINCDYRRNLGENIFNFVVNTVYADARASADTVMRIDYQAHMMYMYIYIIGKASIYMQCGTIIMQVNITWLSFSKIPTKAFP